jgi:hypothetical protein
LSECWHRDHFLSRSPVVVKAQNLIEVCIDDGLCWHAWWDSDIKEFSAINLWVVSKTDSHA